MKDGGRLVSFRAGDIAESLGSVLLQPLCAVAPVPRQEDWGIFDAVGTLLERAGDALFAEDSFFVQFKSPRARPMQFSGRRLRTLRKRELPLFVARVDITTSMIDLFQTGDVLCHSNAGDAESIRIGFRRRAKAAGLDWASKALEGWLTKPVLRWTMADLQCASRRQEIYEVLRAWIGIEQQRRMFAELGFSVVVTWETNAMPTVHEGATQFMWHPSNENRAAAIVSPAIKLIAAISGEIPELSQAAQSLVAWAEKNGSNPDPGRLLISMAWHTRRTKLAAELYKRFPEATHTAHFLGVGDGSGRVDFWIFSRGGSGRREGGSIDDLREQGIEVSWPTGGDRMNVTLTDKWLASRGFVALGIEDEVFLLRKDAVPVSE